MRTAEIESLKNFLLQQKGQILNKSSEFLHEQGSDREFLSDEAEAASQDVSMSLSIHLHERDRSLLYKIERALSRIQSGTYGLCDSCGAEVGIKRLQARPFAELCIECKEEQEEVQRLNHPLQ
ncbi:MAG: TraR/DksA family transcriptional regulator [Pseudobdellovibrionaceae bacterium]